MVWDTRTSTGSVLARSELPPPGFGGTGELGAGADPAEHFTNTASLKEALGVFAGFSSPWEIPRPPVTSQALDFEPLNTGFSAQCEGVLSPAPWKCLDRIPAPVV